jgi:hypothetical protein
MGLLNERLAEEVTGANLDGVISATCLMFFLEVCDMSRYGRFKG